MTSRLFMNVFNQPVYFRVSGVDCGDDVAKWLTSFLKQKCRLIRQNPNVVRRIDSNPGIPMNSRRKMIRGARRRSPMVQPARIFF